MKQTILVCLFITAAYIPLACLDYTHVPYSDGAEHGAVLRELIRDIHTPGEPMLEKYSGKSPRYVPSLFLMAATARLAGINTFTTIKLFSILFFIFFLVSIAFFTREYFQDPEQAFWSIACILFLWGTGWTGANAYMFSAIVYTAWYPSLVAFSCVFMSLACACRFLYHPRLTSFSGWCLFGIIAFVNHPLTAAFLWIASALLIFEIRRFRGFGWFILFIGSSLAAMALWPYYDFYTNLITVTGGSMGGTPDYLMTRHYLYSDIALRTGPALAATPIFFYFIKTKKHIMLTMLCFISLCIYVTGYFLHISLAERFIFAIVFSSQILISRYACTLWRPVHQRTASALQNIYAGALTILIASGLIGQLYISMQEYIFPNFNLQPKAPFIRYHAPTIMHKQLAHYVRPHDIVFSDTATSWGIPLYTGAKIVSLFHTPPHVTDNDVRIKEVRRFYDPSLSNQQRLLILRQFNATKLIIYFHTAGKSIHNQIADMGLRPILQNDELAIFDISINENPTELTPAENNTLKQSFPKPQ